MAEKIKRKPRKHERIRVRNILYFGAFSRDINEHTKTLKTIIHPAGVYLSAKCMVSTMVKIENEKSKTKNFLRSEFSVICVCVCVREKAKNG